MRTTITVLTLLITIQLVAPASAAFLIEVDVDGAHDGQVTYHPNFAFGGDTTTASLSLPSVAVGTTGSDSIYGGDGSAFDTYTYAFAPSIDADNLALTEGTALNGAGDTASGLSGGVSGVYNVYATWPVTTGVSGGLTSYTLSDGVHTLLDVDVEQNGLDGTWVKLGSATLDALTTYTLTQQSGAATFVSMRSDAVMFERVIPEPGALCLMIVGCVGAVTRKFSAC